MKTDTTGKYSYYTRHDVHEVMFHVAPMLPEMVGAEQQVCFVAVFLFVMLWCRHTRKSVSPHHHCLFAFASVGAQTSHWQRHDGHCVSRGGRHVHATHPEPSAAQLCRSDTDCPSRHHILQNFGIKACWRRQMFVLLLLCWLWTS